MKARKVSILLTVNTDAPIKELRNKDKWTYTLYDSGDCDFGAYNFEIEQISVDVTGK